MKKKRQSRSALRSPFNFDRQDNRQMECEYFKSFQYFEPEIQSGSITHDDNPDFLVDVSDRVVGVEVTRLFKPERVQDVESKQEQILEEACWMAQEKKLPPARVTLFFSLRGPLNRAARSRIAGAVVRVVAEQMPADGESVELERALGQPREVDLIIVNRIHCSAPGRWEWFEFGTIERDIAHVLSADQVIGSATQGRTIVEAYLKDGCSAQIRRSHVLYSERPGPLDYQRGV